MKKRIIGLSILISSLLIIFSLAINASNADKKEITILFTHDMHSHFLEVNSIGGFPRLKTAIDQEKAKEKNLIVVDAGDFSMGTLFQTIFTKEAPELRLMGQLGIEVTTFGNHEFDYRAEGLIQMLSAAKNSNEPLPEIVSSNINWEKSIEPGAIGMKKAFEDFGVKEYTILEKDNIRIAIFGQMGKDADACAPMSSLIFEDYVESAKKTIKKIKENENVDLIICLSHGGTWDKKKVSEDEILASKVPEIDVIISGHTHSVLSEPILVNNTYIVSGGEYTKNLGKLKLQQGEDGRWAQNEYKLIPIDQSLGKDPGMLIKIEKFKDLVKENYLGRFGLEFDQIIGRSPYEFTPIDLLAEVQEDDSLGNLIGDSYIYAVKKAEGDNYKNIDFAITASGVIRDTFVKGDISVSNVFNVSSLGIGPDKIPGYPLISIYLTGKEIKAAAEVDASISPIMDGTQLYISGASYRFNPNRLFFNKVTEVKQELGNGEYVELDDKKLYRVVIQLYLAQMLQAVENKSLGLLSVTAKDIEGNPIVDFEKHIVKYNGNELKEWYALALYIMSFDKEDGLPVIPKYYSETHNRKIIDDSKNIKELLKNPNKVFFILLGLIIIIIIIIIMVILLIRKKKRRRRIYSRRR